MTVVTNKCVLGTQCPQGECTVEVSHPHLAFRGFRGSQLSRTNAGMPILTYDVCLISWGRACLCVIFVRAHVYLLICACAPCCVARFLFYHVEQGTMSECIRPYPVSSRVSLSAVSVTWHCPTLTSSSLCRRCQSSASENRSSSSGSRVSPCRKLS